MSASTEFFCRIPKTIELFQDFEEITPIKSLGECRSALYSLNGSYFAYTQPDEVIILDTTNKAQLYYKIEISEIFDLNFSPKGTYLCLWGKPILLNKENGKWNNNVKIFNLKTKTIIAEWSSKNQNGWKPQFTSEETLICKNFNNEIQFYEINSDITTLNLNQPNKKFKLDDNKTIFKLSPGKNPSIAIFIPEKSSQPASISIYELNNFKNPICFKKFFKAEKCEIKWNSLGTALLALASTDHDTTNKSYYGESNLYLLGIAGAYNSRIELTKEGPIHDITWSPSAREFAVSYGYMPSETTFFDARGNSIHSLPTNSRNTILYSPHAKFVLVAGFGNLQGTVDVYDRQNKFSKVVSFEASNTSVCEWSPCGRFILTATTSPRLRVDNGLKIWHASGKLIYLKEFTELYSISWKPQDLSKFPPLKNLEPAPEAHSSAKEYLAKREALANSASKKPAGAYRPPHARGNNNNTTTTLYQKEMESNLKNGNTSTPPPPGLSKLPRQKVIVGAAPVVEKESKAAAKNRKKREAKKKDQSPAPQSSTSVSTSKEEETGGSVLGGIQSLEEKKIRSLLKKLRAIEQLKMKQASGEILEDTQVIKIQKEDEIRNELLSLGWDE